MMITYWLHWLFQLSRSLADEVQISSDGEGIATGIHLWRDDEAFLRSTQSIFLAPEQGSLDSPKLNDLFKEEWFDNEGFLLLEVENRLAGFCWTKVHHQGDLILGEIYAIAVDPDFHGRGFGKRLTTSGLNYLSRVGADLGMLYVEADNKPAVRIYEDIGFTHFSTNRAYRNSV